MWPKDTPRPFKYTITKQDIPDFVNSLHVLQEHYLDAALSQKEQEGFPEANEAINRIMKL